MTDPPPPRVLLAGADVTWLPLMRIGRATEILQGLRARMRTWAGAGGITAEVTYSAVPTRLDIRIRDVQPPPVSEWSLHLGEGLHQLRAAWDALAWDIAHIDGQRPTNPKYVQFPVCDTAKAWNALVATGWLGQVPPDLVARIHALQPFHAGRSFVTALHAFDIADKHRGLLKGRAVISGVEMAGLQFKLTGLEPGMRIQMVGGPLPLESGRLIGSITFEEAVPPDLIITGGPFSASVDFVVEAETGDLAGIELIAEKFPALALEVINGICFGVDGGPDGWTDIPIEVQPQSDP